jgi:hypothetical protein
MGFSVRRFQEIRALACESRLPAFDHLAAPRLSIRRDPASPGRPRRTPGSPHRIMHTSRKPGPWADSRRATRGRSGVSRRIQPLGQGRAYRAADDLLWRLSGRACLRERRRVMSPANRSPTEHPSARHSVPSVLSVVFCAAFSSRLSVGWLIPSRRAISVWVTALRSRSRLSESAS